MIVPTCAYRLPIAQIIARQGQHFKEQRKILTGINGYRTIVGV